MLDKSDVQMLASRLSERLSDFCPKRVVYLETGGEPVGKAVARQLNLPSQGLDISYPASRIEWPWLKALLWPLKELIYRMTVPSIRSPLGQMPKSERLVLIDDSAGTGRTLRVALDALRELGIDESLVRVAVIRCGKRARSLVDYFEIGERVLFKGR